MHLVLKFPGLNGKSIMELRGEQIKSSYDCFTTLSNQEIFLPSLEPEDLTFLEPVSQNIRTKEKPKVVRVRSNPEALWDDNAINFFKTNGVDLNMQGPVSRM